MPIPFPGMDPWLEHPALWPDVHQRLITYAGDRLGEQLGDGFYVAIGERVYVEVPSRTFPDVSVVEARPDRLGGGASSTGSVVADAPTIVRLRPIERREPYLELRSAHGDQQVITVIEVLSPANKRPGAGRELYLRKQAEVLVSTASLVEIDLLRGGEPTVALPAECSGTGPYRVLVSRSSDREARELYAADHRARLPRVRVPVVKQVADLVLNLGALLGEAYERGMFARRVDYTKDPVPPLDAETLAWARTLVGAGR